MKVDIRGIWRIWIRFGNAVGNLVGRVLLTVFYFTVFAPFGIGMRLFGDPLAIKHSHRPQWLKREIESSTIEDARRLS